MLTARAWIARSLLSATVPGSKMIVHARTASALNMSSRALADGFSYCLFSRWILTGASLLPLDSLVYWVISKNLATGSRIQWLRAASVTVDECLSVTAGRA